MTETDEKVLCVSSEHVVNVLRDVPDREQALAHMLAMERYVPRSQCETDESLRQLIPYIAVVNSKGQILAYNRGRKGGEKRLESRWAIGFGGHVNDQDADWRYGIAREIHEELDGLFDLVCQSGRDEQILHGPIGFINDDSDDVGRHHLGVVYVLRADEVTPKEVLEFSWETFESLRVGAEAGLIHLESWARLALPMVREWMESEGE